MSVDAVVVHRVPGRIRLRLPHMRGDAGYFERLQVDIGAALPQASVCANAASASVLVTGPEEAVAGLGRAARENDWFDIRSDDPDRTVSAIRLPFASDHRPLLMATLLLLAVVQILRGQIMVPAATLLWYAYALDSDFFVLGSGE